MEDHADDQELPPSQRMISASCFRVLSFQPEIQNDEEVLKPILEELEVLRLSCALGALKSVNPKDFDYELLEAKDLDDELAHFLRSEVFGGARNENGTQPPVRVVGVFGKQEQVQTHLKRLGAWDAAMDAHLHMRENGLYAAMLPECTVKTDGLQTVVMFTWLLDEFFEPARLRETPTYLLRLLTCLTKDVTCCISTNDKRFLEGFVKSEKSAGGYGSWRNSYSVAFRVEQQEDQQDDVHVVKTKQVPLPHMNTTPHKIGLVKGSCPALVALMDSTQTTDWIGHQKAFQQATQFATWISTCATKFKLQTSPQNWSDEMVEAVLKRFDMWPHDKLHQLNEAFGKDAAVVKDPATQLREHVSMRDSVRARLQAACTKIFCVESMFDDPGVNESIATVKMCLEQLRFDPAFVLPDHLDTVLRLPIRLPRLMEEFYNLFQKRKEDELCDLLQRTPQARLVELVSAGNFFALTTFETRWVPFGKKRLDTTMLGAFRERMRVPLETMQADWWATTARVFDEYSNHATRVRVRDKLKQLDMACHLACAAAAREALDELVGKWSSQSDVQLSMRVQVRHSRGYAIQCSVREEVSLSQRIKLHVWGVEGAASKTNFTHWGAIALCDGEELVDTFSIQKRLILVIVVVDDGTVVRRIDFPVKRETGLGAQTQTAIKRLGRRVTLCDYCSDERMLVLADAEGKVCVYRLQEKFGSLEALRSLDAAVQTTLQLPLQDVVLSDGVLYLVDHIGDIQALNTRNTQTSHKQQLVGDSAQHSPRSRLVRVLGGAILGWICTDPSSPTTTTFQFRASDDMRRVAQCVREDLQCSDTKVECSVFDESLYVVDGATRTMHTFRFDATLKSESFRIRKFDRRTEALCDPIAGARCHDPTQHWLWAFYHVYEKFPVWGELFRDEDGEGRTTLALVFVCDVSSRAQSKVLLKGCEQLLGAIVHKLRALNKPLEGIDLTRDAPKVFCGAQASSAALEYYYKMVPPQPVNVLLQELITFVPIQICRAEYNTLTLMSDGQPCLQQEPSDQDGGLHSADIAQTLRFGLLTPLLLSWSGRCIVVTSMGKQSTGKSYFLNHLTGTSFAISGARCTDGAWMSVRLLPRGVLLVVMDFEGLGSFERTEQEDMFLSVLNASVSMHTIFRMEMRFDKEIDELFSRFQKGSLLLKQDAHLFRGKQVKDVNPNDQHGVVSEFVSKFERLLEANKEQNFLTDMYAGQLDINCSPPLGTTGYYRSLAVVREQIESRLCGDSTCGYPSGKAFLDCIRLLLSKIAILDWTSLDESVTKLKIADILTKLPGVLRLGCVVARMDNDAERMPSFREQLIDSVSCSAIAVSLEDVCAANATLKDTWLALRTSVPIDQIDDETIDFGPCVNLIDIQAASRTLQSLFRAYVALVGVESREVVLLKRPTQLDFDQFVSFLVRRRCLRVQRWCRSMFGGRTAYARVVASNRATGVHGTANDVGTVPGFVLSLPVGMHDDVDSFVSRPRRPRRPRLRDKSRVRWHVFVLYGRCD